MALDLTGVDTDLAWYAEVDPDAARIMAHHHPAVTSHGDITGGSAEHIAAERARYTEHGVGRLAKLPDDTARLAWADAYMRRSATGWARTLPPVDVLTAGWPCQENSAAGKRRGAAGDRHLWPAVAAIVGETLPPVFIGENVPGILTIDRGARIREVCVDLNRLGYTVRWTTLGACRVGACHHRHRVFILATRVPVDPPEGSMFGVPLSMVRKWPAAGHVQDGQLWPMVADVCGVTAGTVFPTPTASDGNSRGSGLGTYPNPEGRPLREVVAMLPDSQSAGGLAPLAAVRPERWGQWAESVARHEAVTGVRAPDPTVPGVRGGRRLSAQLVEWMMMLPAGWVTDLMLPNVDPRPDRLSREMAIKALGNGVVPAQASAALRILGLDAAVRAISPALVH